MYLKIDETVSLRYQVNPVANARAVIVINHGFAEHLGRYDYVVTQLNKAGYSVYRYDIRGHGKSIGPKGHLESYRNFITDCDAIVDLAQSQNPELGIYILGHSMGGFVSAMYGIEFGHKLKGQILSGPAVGIVPKAKGARQVLLKLLSKIAPKLTLANAAVDHISSDPEVVAAFKADPDVLKRATVSFLKEFLVEGPEFIKKNAKDYQIPLLLLLGGADSIVPPQIGHNFYTMITSNDKTEKIYPNLYHEILNEPSKDEVLKDIVAWLHERTDKRNC